jgi:hypothetical protein
VTIGVKNEEFRKSRKLLLNWYCYAVEADDAEYPSTSGRAVQRWMRPEEAREFTVRGPAPTIPGDYRLLISLTPLQQQSVEAEALRHQIGEVVADLQASGNRAIYHDPAQRPAARFLTFGGYHNRPPGMYETAFRIKVGDNTIDRNILRLDVAVQGGHPIRELRLRGTDFSEADTYQTFVLPYALREYTRDVEFRVWTEGQTAVWVDAMETVFQQGTWADESVTVVE